MASGSLTGNSGRLADLDSPVAFRGRECLYIVALRREEVCPRRMRRQRRMAKSPDELMLVLPGLVAWIKGKPLAAISRRRSEATRTRARRPSRSAHGRENWSAASSRGASRSLWVWCRTSSKKPIPLTSRKDLSRQLVECLGAAVRKGYDLPEKVCFASNNPAVLSRVQIHELWTQREVLG